MNTFLKLFLISSIIISFARCDETLELSCTSHDDCKSFEDRIVESRCQSGRCACSIRRPNMNELAKIDCKPLAPKKNFGNNQNLKECPCTRPNTECINNKCECSKDFQATRDGRCIAIAVNLEKACEIHDQCRQKDKFSECGDNRTCKCIDQFHQIRNSCRSIVNKAKSNCAHNSDCDNENEECLDSRCVCKENFVASTNPDDRKCLQTAKYGEKCEESNQCIYGLGVGSTCDKQVCVCNANHTKFDDAGKVLCQRNIRVGDHCEDHNECVPYKGEAKMICSKEEKCICNEGYELFDAYQKKCIKSELKSSSQLMKSLHVFLTLILVFVVSKVLM